MNEKSLSQFAFRCRRRGIKTTTADKASRKPWNVEEHDVVTWLNKIHHDDDKENTSEHHIGFVRYFMHQVARVLNFGNISELVARFRLAVKT
jgi:hypothetical protein